MVAFVDITGAERLSMGKALNGAQRVARVKLMGSSGPIASRPMLWPCAGEILNGMHDLPDVVAPEIDLVVVHRAVAGGSGAQLKLDDAYVHAGEAYPAYIRYRYEHDIAADAWRFDVPVRKRLDRAFVITHYNYVWGHWLTEMYPKLFLIRALLAVGVVAPLLLPVTAPAYVARIAQELVPDLEIVTYYPRDEAVEIGTVLLPHMLSQDYYFHDFLRRSLEREALAWPRGGTPDKVFVSRAGVGATFRELTNEAEIEGLAEELGLTLVRPETLPWIEQARIFSRASVVAGEFGSGLHNALLSPAGCQVVSLNWLVDVQSRIANFRRQDVGYILPADGRARLHAEEQQSQPFTIDPVEFRAKLALAVGRAEARAVLAGWDDGPTVLPELIL
uniref:glycosyltransferase family 61 protein n=1 Tax=uncultured Caulobacter sp. TaxID=158749 RepID=UPI0025D1D599|nr:glycosyltransferase 61 family protein [uncultured Caulobacter sp.]